MAETPALPFVSVIVPVYNDAGRLSLCLAALEVQTYPVDRYEVIVVDNGSEPPLTTVLGDFPHVRFESEPRPGGSQARVTGINCAHGEILAFTDADCRPEPTWLANGVSCFQQTPNCGFVGGRIEVFAEGPATTATMLSMATHLKQERFLRGHWAACANLFTSRAIIEQVGPMNPELISAGEVEWGRRVHAAGYQQIYAPEAVVRHPARTSVRQLCRRAVRFEFAWKQLRETVGIGRGARFWVGQHLIWPMRDTWQDVVRNPRLTLIQKAQATMLSVLLILLRIVVWLMMLFGFRPDLRHHWG